MQFLACIFVFCPLISALAFNAPEATPVAEILKLHPQGWSPQPTEPPQFNKELLKRQSSSSLTLIEGPDGVCGYQFGVADAALGLCGSTDICGFATAFGAYGEIVCFDSTTNTPRPLWTSCVGGSYATSCLLDPVCSGNSEIIICPATESYCNIGTFIGLGIEVLWCDYTYQTGTIPISTTYVGEIGRAFTQPFLSVTTTKISTSSTLQSTISSPITTSRPFTTIPVSPTTTASPKSSPTGPIVGGVIGGLALIAAIAAGIFICMRYKLSGKRTPNEYPDLPTPGMNPQNNLQPQNPLEKYSATTQATFIPPAVPIKQEYPPSQQPQYQQPPYQPQYQQPSLQPQYQQPPPVAQPSYNNYQAQQQHSPQAAGSYAEQQQPVQNQQYPAQTFQVEPQASTLQPKVSQELSGGEYRDSVVSTTSIPGGIAPPYTSTMPKVPEMTGESSHYAYPVNDRYEIHS